MESMPFRLLIALFFLFSAGSVLSAANPPVEGQPHIELANADFLRPVVARALQQNGSEPNAILSALKAFIAQYDTSTTLSQAKNVESPAEVLPRLPKQNDHFIPEQASSTTTTPPQASTSIASSPEPTSLLDCCVSGACPSSVCRNLVRAPTTDLQELLFCCLSNKSCPPNVCHGLKAVTTNQSLSQPNAPETSPLPLPAADSNDGNATTFECCRTGTCATNICFGLPPLDDVQKLLQHNLAKASRPLPPPSPPAAKSEL